MASITDQLGQAFVCPRCHKKGGTAKKLAMSGTGISRMLEIQPYRYAFVSCTNCGYTEVFNLTILNQRDDLSSFLDVLFMD
jgi:predicted nucleic-acid-binding Zn-ribbon protein